MGIEPTNHDFHRSPTGFEDQAYHQIRSTSKPREYIITDNYSASNKTIESLYFESETSDYSEPKSWPRKGSWKYCRTQEPSSSSRY